MIEKNWKEIIKPSKLEIVEDTYTDTYGRFNAQPLERGFGVTIGNSLRRILLSSIYGSAIIGVRFEESVGVLHEFSSISGVYEDVTDIILNLKKVVMRMHTDKPQTVTLEKKGPCEVTAGDIETGRQDRCDQPGPDHRHHPERHHAQDGTAGGLGKRLCAGRDSSRKSWIPMAGYPLTPSSPR